MFGFDDEPKVGAGVAKLLSDGGFEATSSDRAKPATVEVVYFGSVVGVFLFKGDSEITKTFLCDLLQ